MGKSLQKADTGIRRIKHAKNAVHTGQRKKSDKFYNIFSFGYLLLKKAN